MKIPKVKSKDLLTITDFSRDEILEIFELSSSLKTDLKNGKHHGLLSKKTLAMIFEKSSTRTRVSFETGMHQLEGHALFLTGKDIQLKRGESLSDTAKVLSRYVDCIMVRTYSHENAITLASNATVPVINGLTDTFHPCQSLTDYFTIYEREKDISNVKLVYVGDGNNVANSLLLGAALLGINLSIASPENYMPDSSVIDESRKLAAKTGSNIDITVDIDKAVKGADYLYTDVWISMGQDDERAKRLEAFSEYKITKEMLNRCNDRCLVMHCLPAHRGEEIDADVMDSEKSIIFDQAENRLHVQKAIMCALML